MAGDLRVAKIAFSLTSMYYGILEQKKPRGISPGFSLCETARLDCLTATAW